MQKVVKNAVRGFARKPSTVKVRVVTGRSRGRRRRRR